METGTKTFSLSLPCAFLTEAISATIYVLHVTGCAGRLSYFENLHECKEKVGRTQNPGEPLNDTMLGNFNSFCLKAT